MEKIGKEKMKIEEMQVLMDGKFTG